jgi:hypothetical protein
VQPGVENAGAASQTIARFQGAHVATVAKRLFR